MDTPTNHERAEWAHASIQLFAENTGLDTSGDDEETAFRDLMCNLRHWCAERDIDFDDVVESSREVFEEEVAEEEEYE